MVAKVRIVSSPRCSLSTSTSGSCGCFEVVRQVDGHRQTGDRLLSLLGTVEHDDRATEVRNPNLVNRKLPLVTAVLNIFHSP